jgi:NAD(P)-dependent dehydrogenase (short-subunit alcohol dehydrogenase family)
MNRKHALIIGFGPGIGLGAAKAFGEAGFDLSLLSRNPDKTSDSVASLNSKGIAAKQFTADAGSSESLTEAIENAVEEFGDVDVLIYNAAAYSPGKPTTLNLQTFAKDFEINVIGALAASKAVLPAMLSKKSGTIFFTGGGFGLYPSAAYTSLSVTKAGLRNLAFTLAEELKGTGVRVATVTVIGYVKPGTAVDPEKIGNEYLKLYNTDPESFPTEVQFTGA